MRSVVSRYASADAFEERALPFLLEREAEHNLFIGIVGQIRDGRYTDFYLATAERDGAVVGAAFRTPPFNLGLSYLADDDVVDALVADVADVYDTLPAVTARRDFVHAFADRWTATKDVRAETGLRQRIYELREVTHPSGVEGELRKATIEHRDLIIEWLRGFNEDAFDSSSVERTVDPTAIVDYRLSASHSPLYLWWTDRPVSMAGTSGPPTPNGVRVNAVYTPRELRGNGYASACVAALSQRSLDEGSRFCFLYTNLANPTSNKIYQEIGYRPVCDVDEVRFR